MGRMAEWTQGRNGRDLASGVHGLGIGGNSSAASARPASLDDLLQLAQAADSLGYEAVLTRTARTARMPGS